MTLFSSTKELGYYKIKIYVKYLHCIPNLPASCIHLGTNRESALKKSRNHLVSFRPFPTVDASDSSSAKYVARYAYFYLYTTLSGYEASIFFFFFFLISFAPLHDSGGSARRPGSGKRSYKRKAEAALAFSTLVVREGEIKSGKKARCRGKRGRGV